MNMQNNELNFEGVDIYVGLDTHKTNWKITIHIDDMVFRTFSQTPPSAETLYTYLKKNFPGGLYHIAYEAGFCGFWICHYFSKKGIDCIVVNPADIPTKDKEKRQKEDKRDSRKIARCLSNGELDAIHVPSIKTIEDRFLMRTRQRLVRDLTRYKCRIKSALYFQGIDYPRQFEKSGTHWSNKFIKWLEQIKQTQQSGKKAFEVMLSEITHLRGNLLSVNRKIREMSKSEEYGQSTSLLMGIPGIGLITAMVLITELEDIHRFSNINQLCSFVGLIPSMNNSSDTIKETDITARGNMMLRGMLIESAWITIRHDPAMALKYYQLSKRMEPTKAIVRIAKKLTKRINYVLKNQKEYVRSVA
jgi:transposase